MCGCIYVYLCVYAYIYIHTYIYINIHIYIYIYIYTHTHTYIHIYIHTRTHAHMIRPAQIMCHMVPSHMNICIHMYTYKCEEGIRGDVDMKTYTQYRHVSKVGGKMLVGGSFFFGIVQEPTADYGIYIYIYIYIYLHTYTYEW